MKKIGYLAILSILLLTAGCAQDPSKYDVTSPCVANISEIYLDQPCARRLPVENLVESYIMTAS